MFGRLNKNEWEVIKKKKICKEPQQTLGLSVVTRIGRFLVQIPPGAQPGSGTQTCYEAPGDLRVETRISQRLTSSE